MVINVEDLRIKIFADGADLPTMLEMSKKSHIKGLTTNPTLMRKAGIKSYREFAKHILEEIQDKPISFEVFSDDLQEMVKQASEIASWGENVNVKIPVTNSEGVDSLSVIKELSHRGIALNITALFTIEQVENVVRVLNKETSAFLSVFAGRIADTGRDPIPIIKDSLQIMEQCPKFELIWASPRELLNVIQANDIGCHIITATSDVLKKFDLIGKNLVEYSLETVKMFRDDAVASGYRI